MKYNFIAQQFRQLQRRLFQAFGFWILVGAQLNVCLPLFIKLPPLEKEGKGGKVSSDKSSESKSANYE